MRLAVRFTIVGQVCLWFAIFARAQQANTVPQLTEALVPLQLDSDARPTQVPAYATLAGAQCDGSGNVYLRYVAPGSASYAPGIAKIHSDGETERIPLGNIPGAADASHTFIFAPGSDGTLHEIVRTENAAVEDPVNQIDYVRFDPDGDIRSTANFRAEFIPSVLLPLPSGEFFATGVTIKPTADGVTESSVAGIFSADAQQLRPLRTPQKKNSKDASSIDPDTLLQGGTARLGGDGNIYALLGGDEAKVAVIQQSGQILRVMSLHGPQDSYSATDMWVSGGRLLVSYAGGNDASGSEIYVLYDASTGEPIRSYRPEFSGVMACFEDGQTISVLVRDSGSGSVDIASGELQ